MMNHSKKQIIGLFGFGVVGEGLYHVLQHSHTTNAQVKTICVMDPGKPRSLPDTSFTFQADDILNDPEINLVVELINDSQAAFHIVRSALLNGKSVVSGNKQMLAFHLEELLAIQEQTGAALLYDASACGSIPVIRNLEEYYDNDLLLSITGILNGSSNYVLSRVFNDNMEYQEALELARKKGFAEADPSLDMGGWDALYKLVILCLHGFGAIVNPAEVFVAGIAGLAPPDIQFAREKGYRIKLVAQVSKLDKDKIYLLVMPKMVKADDYIFNVEDEYNGVVINGAFYEKQFMFGKGAGGHPTGSAVLSDITARMHGYRYEYKKRRYFSIPRHTNDVEVKIYLRYTMQSDLDAFAFESIEERHSGQDHHYVIGTIKLENLLRIQQHICSIRGFLAFFESQTLPLKELKQIVETESLITSS